MLEMSKRGDDLIRTKSCHLKVFMLGCRRWFQNVNSEVLRVCDYGKKNVTKCIIEFAQVCGDCLDDERSEI